MVTHSMTIRKLLTTVLCSLTVIFVVTRASAADKTFKRSVELKKRTAKTSKDVDRYVIQLERTEHALSSVSRAEGRDLTRRYESFTEEMRRLENAQQHTTSDIDELEAIGAEYFSSWDRSIAQISSPELKQASTERRAKVMEDHEAFDVSLSDIRSQLQPFMNNLRDVEAFLGTGPLPANVANATEMIQKSQADAQVLKDKIAGAQTTLKRLQAEAAN